MCLEAVKNESIALEYVPNEHINNIKKTFDIK